MYDRTARNPYGSYRLSKRRRRWETVSWWLSSIFAVALVAWALTWWFGIRGDENSVATAGRVITFQVMSAENGQPLVGAQVSYPGGSAPTDANGTVSLALADESVNVDISAPGYQPVYGTAGTNIDQLQKISLNPAAPATTNELPVTAATTAAEPTAAGVPTSTLAPSPTMVASAICHRDRRGNAGRDGWRHHCWSNYERRRRTYLGCHDSVWEQFRAYLGRRCVYARERPPRK